MKFKNILFLIFPAATLAGGFFFLRELAVPEVAVATVTRGTATLTATGNVTVIPALEAQVRATEKGTVIEFEHKEGDRVKKGDLIARLDAGNLPFQLQQLENNLARLRERRKIGPSAQATRDYVRGEMEASEKLHGKGYLTGSALLDVKARLARMDVDLLIERINLDYDERGLEIQVAQLRDQLGRYEMRAPLDGVIMTPACVRGDIVFAGNSITKISSTRKLVKVEVNQDDLAAVRASTRVSVTFAAHNGSYEGVVDNLVPVGDSKTQRFTVFLKMKTLPEGLLSGQTGEAAFIANQRANALLVPVNALMGESVYVVREGRTQRRKVETGYISVLTAEIRSGLEAGEQVVVRDVDLQRDGARVQPKSVQR
ncbi:MAG: efflux RND transporter periplasmic adaptor subunit [Puniceicoccales bacterium]|jgi:RND family efflux transporter MFP subunit|nr:efflux RND transporter periplasmic adaptor subunit [Puniceicoccales bacterium]